MFGTPGGYKAPVPRTVWAAETEKQLKAIAKKLCELRELERAVKEKCNHTNPDGTSTLTSRYNDDGGYYTSCSVCEG